MTRSAQTWVAGRVEKPNLVHVERTRSGNGVRIGNLRATSGSNLLRLRCILIRVAVRPNRLENALLRLCARSSDRGKSRIKRCISD